VVGAAAVVAAEGSFSVCGAIEAKKAAGRDPTHGTTAAARRAETNIARKREVSDWDERYGKLVDLSAFEREILPLVQDVPLSRLQRATGLSLRYVSLIRRGERTPHPRHRQRLKSLGLSSSSRAPARVSEELQPRPCAQAAETALHRRAARTLVDDPRSLDLLTIAVVP
jgi:hypothetical protein